MDPALTLFILRLASAALLLLFLATIGWLIYKDMRLTAAELAARQRQHGALRVLADGAAPESGETFPLLPVTSIGRAPGNTLVLDDSYASNEHALISLRGNQWWLEDLGSRNGTLLNDLPLDGAAVVTAGDVITIGATRLKIEF